MGLTATRPANARLRRVGALVSAALPLLLLLSGLDDRAGLARSGPGLAAALELEPALAPSLPTLALLRLLAWLPIGSLGARAALAGALCSAVTAAALFLAAETLSRVQGVGAPRVGFALALGGAWSVIAFDAVWQAGLEGGQAAAALALAAVALERLTTLEASWPSRDARPLAAGGLALGLLLACEPRAGLVLLPACLPSAVRVLRARPSASGRLATLGLGLGLACLASSMVLGASPGAWLRQATTAGQLTLWRQLWQAAPLGVGLGALGAFGLLFAPGAHRLGQLWTAALALPLLVATLGPSGGADRPPDAAPYLFACAALAVLAVSFLASLLAGSRAGGLVTAFALCATLLGAASLERANRLAQARSDQGRAAEWLVVRLQTELPARALLLLASGARADLLAALWAEGRERPDLQRVALDSLGELSRAERLGRRHPELRPLLRSFLFEGQLGEASLQSLTGQRPVRIELAAHVAPALYPGLLPDGLWYDVPDAAGNELELRSAERRQAASRDALTVRLDGLPIEPLLGELLARQHYFAALYYAARARPASAHAELEQARRTAPRTPALAALAAALAKHGDDAVDAEPFVDRW
jgi:hypothetical protein